jgi:1-acyl-sn-glycerol-3-phosphate acyltransferase
MLYPITRPLAKIALSVFFRKLYLSGMEHVDWDKPVILAANHPTAFIEPCILACWVPKPLHFMVRGDLFLKPLSNWVLRDFNMIPMFRIGDAGVAGVKANYRSVEEASQVLHTHHPVLILAEGSTAHEKRLRPLQKGTARIALGTEDQRPDLGIQLVPVGVNYTYADRFRSEVMIHFGKPLLVHEYLDAYRENPANGLRELTEALRGELEKHVVTIEEKGDEKWVDQLLVMYRNDQAHAFAPQTVYDGSRLANEKRITALVNDMPEGEKEPWKRTVEAYARELNRYGASDRALVAGGKMPWTSFLLLIMGAPLFLLALVFHLPPLWLAGKIGYGKRVPRYEFKASVAMATGLVLYQLWGIVLLIAGLLLAGLLGALVLVLGGLALLGWFGLWYLHAVERAKTHLEYRKMPREAQEELRGRRAEIAAFFDL